MSTDTEPEWKYYLMIGITILFNSIFFQIGPNGPWNDKSFTLGSLVFWVLYYATLVGIDLRSKKRTNSLVRPME